MESNLPDRLQKQRQYLTCGLEGPRDSETFSYAGSFASMGVDNSFSISKLKNNFKIEIKELSNERVIFDLINIDVSIANAIRRILIAEVPTVAIETVHLWQNTGVVQDEVLAHRLGLIPFKINPDMVQWRKENEDLTEDNSIKFKLHVKCTEKDIPVNLNHMPVYAKNLIWEPLSQKQAEKFSSCPPEPVEPTILITKLRPGQEIEAELYCEKGIGKTHAKWSPVSTAVYRLLPTIEFQGDPLVGADAEELKKLCPVNVFDVEDGAAVCHRARSCTTCRACLERFPNQVVLRKDKGHFIFTIESTGCIPAANLFERAVTILKEKAIKIKTNLNTSVSAIPN